MTASHSPGTPAPAETPERHHDGSAPVGAPALSPADTARLLLQCARSWDPEARLVGNVRSKDVEALCLHCMAASRAPVAPTGIAADPDATATEVSSLKLWPARQRTYIGAIQYALDTLAAHGVGDTNGCADLRLLRDCIADPAANWQARPPAFAPTHTDMMITPEAIAAMDFPDTSAASPSIAATPKLTVEWCVETFHRVNPGYSMSRIGPIPSLYLFDFARAVLAIAATPDAPSDLTANGETAQ